MCSQKQYSDKAQNRISIPPLWELFWETSSKYNDVYGDYQQGIFQEITQVIDGRKKCSLWLHLKYWKYVNNFLLLIVY